MTGNDPMTQPHGASPEGGSTGLERTQDQLEIALRERDEARDMRDTYRAALKDLQDDDCVRSARRIAEFLAAKFYPNVPEFKPFDGLAGLLSQIDNMVAGIATPEAREVRLRGVLKELLEIAELYIPVPLEAPGFRRARAALAEGPTS